MIQELNLGFFTWDARNIFCSPTEAGCRKCQVSSPHLSAALSLILHHVQKCTNSFMTLNTEGRVNLLNLFHPLEYCLGFPQAFLSDK